MWGFFLIFAIEKETNERKMEDKNKGKLLVIDDNEDILFALNLLLKPLVEDIRVTKQPEQIDRFYDLLHPDVVLLDGLRRCRQGGAGAEEWRHRLHHQAVGQLQAAGHALCGHRTESRTS